MKRKFILLVTMGLIGLQCFSNGVVFEQQKTGVYLQLQESAVEVTIENQVAITKATQVFYNSISDSMFIKYAFPLPENASATKLRYNIGGQWHTALFSPVPQDTTTGDTIGPGADVDYTLLDYLGENPLFYKFDDTLQMESTIIVELTYVELLHYELGKVNYYYPNDYSKIQSSALENQSFAFELTSERTISDLHLLTHNAEHIENTGSLAKLDFSLKNELANANIWVQYELNLDELGLYSLSTYIPDSLQKDEYGRGFCTFIIEPDPSENTEVMSKIFTLIIDRSGSMSGDKIVQAREAAKFITKNLNVNDKFNIVSFSTDVSSFRSSHVDYTMENEQAAIDYINTLESDGSTNISGAFDVAVPQFTIVDNTKANIIIFFTDGEQTAGITDTDDLIGHINNLMVNSEKNISLFTFGIGASTNERLLTSIAADNGGLSKFLKDDELEQVITDFYLMVKNPVLLNTEITIEPSIVLETYPRALQNLYKGQQLVLVGRYSEPVQALLTIKGKAFSQDVSYTYNLELADTNNIKYQFLTKIWAKVKIDELMNQYYQYMSSPEIADSLKEVIIKLSIDYGVISPFTSFQGGDDDDDVTTVSILEFENEEMGKNILKNEYIELLSVGPNPCNGILNIELQTTAIANGELTIELTDVTGVVHYSTLKTIAANTNYGHTINCKTLGLKGGVYLLSVSFNNKILSSKIIIN